MAAEQLDVLTPREREILALIAEGESLPEIAQRLHRSLKTIESHRLSLGRKLNASNRVELARIAIAAGLVKIDSHSFEPPLAHDTSDWAETELAWLEQINDAVHPSVRGSFLQRFCNAASRLPGIDVAAICTPDPEQGDKIDPYNRFIMAIAERGEPGEGVRYYAKGTPCERIITDGECFASEGVRSAFPQDTILQQLKAESCIGVCLRNNSGDAVGGLGLIGRQPIQDINAYRRVLAFFAPRVATELEQLNRMQAMQREQEAMREQIRVYQRALAERGDEVPGISLLARLESRVDHLVGARFIRGLVDNFSAVYGLRFAGICIEHDRDGEPGFYSITMSEWAHQVDTITYARCGTPCETVWAEGQVCVTANVAAVYPEDKSLTELGLDSYIGVRLDTASGERVGVMWVIDEKPIEDPEPIRLALERYRTRLAAEVEQHIRLNRALSVNEHREPDLNGAASGRQP